MIVCGIDPGFSGALAIVNDFGDCDTMDIPILGTASDKLINSAMIARFLGDFNVEFAVVEKAQAMPKQGVSSCFRYGVSYGQILAVLQCGLIPYQTVPPRKWKKDMRLSTDKSLSRLRATELLPKAAKQFELVKDHGRAEAALLALWYMQSMERKA